MTEWDKLLALSDPPTLGEIANVIDLLVNPEAGPRKEGFILVRFRHNEPDRPRFAASCDNQHTLRILRLLTAHLEGRISGEHGNA